MESLLGCASVVIVWILLSVAAGSVAERKGLEKSKYVLLSLLLSPLVGLILAAAAGPNQAKADELRVSTGTERKCPYCAELVKREAIVCRYCGKDLPPAEAVVTPPIPTPERGIADHAAAGPRFKTKEEFAAWKVEEANRRAKSLFPDPKAKGGV